MLIATNYLSIARAFFAPFFFLLLYINERQMIVPYFTYNNLVVTLNL